MTIEQTNGQALAQMLWEELDRDDWGDIDPTWFRLAANPEEEDLDGYAPDLLKLCEQVAGWLINGKSSRKPDTILMGDIKVKQLLEVWDAWQNGQDKSALKGTQFEMEPMVPLSNVALLCEKIIDLIDLAKKKAEQLGAPHSLRAEQWLEIEAKLRQL